MKKEENTSLVAFGFVAAFVLVMATPALAEKVISSSTTTTVGAPVTNTTSAATNNADGSTTINTRTTTTQPTRTVTYTIKQNDEKRLQEYLSKEYRDDGCKKGMVYYDGKCIADTSVSDIKRTYIIGQSLPTNVDLLPLPKEVLGSMTPVPEGFYYSQLDRDILLINRKDGKVVDSVSYYSM